MKKADACLCVLLRVEEGGDFDMFSHISSLPGASPPLLDYLLWDFKLNESMLLPATGRLRKMLLSSWTNYVSAKVNLIGIATMKR